MKTKIFIALVLLALAGLTFGAFAQNTTIVRASFSRDTAVLHGSNQWIDVSYDDMVQDSGNLTVFITHFSANLGFTFFRYDTLLCVNYRDFWNTAQQNSDGTRRAFFTLPNSYPYEQFLINVNYSINWHGGIFGQPLSLHTLAPSIPNHTKTYYTLQGQLTTDPHGIVIEQTPTTRRLVYLP